MVSYHGYVLTEPPMVSIVNYRADYESLAMEDDVEEEEQNSADDPFTSRLMTFEVILPLLSPTTFLRHLSPFPKIVEKVENLFRHQKINFHENSPVGVDKLISC